MTTSTAHPLTACRGFFQVEYVTFAVYGLLMVVVWISRPCTLKS
ncbi:MAG TPA: hypothetical protein VKS20_16065 [Candidatus Acidoferrales bacterium]|nr:hypothetical protein [Candidatus Acidoferrales bacterium]